MLPISCHYHGKGSSHVQMNIPEKLLDNDLLFHFTKPYVALENILHEKKVRFSSLVNMNDPYEYKIISTGVSAWGGISQETASEANSMLKNSILYKSKILSLVRDKENNIENNFRLVFAKPRLWAQYAEAQYGVCLIFSLNAFLEKIKRLYPELSVYHDYVEYDLSSGNERSKTYLRNYDTSKSIEENIQNHIKINQKYIYFCKYRDFQDENEYRIVLVDWKDNKNNDIYIDMQGIIRGVILGERFHIVYEDIIKSLVSNLNADLYRIFYAPNVVLKKY